jgi:hypothetical protein
MTDSASAKNLDQHQGKEREQSPHRSHHGHHGNHGKKGKGERRSSVTVRSPRSRRSSEEGASPRQDQLSPGDGVERYVGDAALSHDTSVGVRKIKKRLKQAAHTLIHSNMQVKNFLDQGNFDPFAAHAQERSVVDVKREGRGMLIQTIAARSFPNETLRESTIDLMTAAQKKALLGRIKEISVLNLDNEGIDYMSNLRYLGTNLTSLNLQKNKIKAVEGLERFGGNLLSLSLSQNRCQALCPMP